MHRKFSIGEQPDWTPAAEFVETTNAAWLMHQVGVETFDELHAWSVRNRPSYWALALERLGVILRRPYESILNLTDGVEAPRWLDGALLNIVESCFTAPASATAILSQKESGEMGSMTFGELAHLTGQVANGLARLGYGPGTAVGIYMPMTAESVAIYLGVVKAGCVVVGIADSFRPQEIATRLRLAGAPVIFTQDVSLRNGNEHPLYECVVEAGAPAAIVLPADDKLRTPLRPSDIAWEDFLDPDATGDPILRGPEAPINILFSSGTTGDPKAIPWTQTTPIKCAADAHFHQDIRPGDVLVWPTNLGWMMGPWLIFASLINQAAMGLYSGSPGGGEFCRFVQDSRATMLGVIPSLVKTWRAADSTRDCDWTAIRTFSSTGECSNVADMQWLMAQAGGRPIVEYCGGTEIGGGYITGTVAKECFAGTFNTPALGLDFIITGEDGQPSERGEIHLVPPSIGLSNTLLNKDHHTAYFEGTPAGPSGEVLRRHGDQMEALPGRKWRTHGRADDTMNLGGIKVSSAEIERACEGAAGVTETAAIAASPEGGPDRLVVFAVRSESSQASEKEVHELLQREIRTRLNPLFKVHEVVFIEALPRTVTNKVMRRVLRDQYSAGF